MADYWANDNGLWSTTSNWLTAVGEFAGILPTSADDVYSNNKIIYIDGDYHVNSIRNISAVDITKGGYFVANDGVSLSAYVYGGGVASVACLQFLSAAPASATLVGNLCAGDPTARVSSAIAFSNQSSGDFTIIGNSDGVLYVQSGGGNTHGVIRNMGSGNLYLYGFHNSSFEQVAQLGSYAAITNNSSGNVFLSGGVTAGNNWASVGIRNFSNGNIYLTGYCIGGNQSDTYGIFNNSVGSIFVTGSAYGTFNTGGGEGIRNISSGIVYLVGNCYGGRGAPGIRNNSSTGIINITGIVEANMFSNGRDGVSNESTGTINVSGIIVGGNTGTSTWAAGIRNISSGTVNVTGVVIGGVAAGAYGINNNASGIINLNGIVIGRDSNLGSGGYGIFNNTTGTISGNIIAIAGPRTNSHAIFNNGNGGRVFVKKAIGSGWGVLSNNPLSDNPAYGAAVAVFNNAVSGLCYVEEIECGSRGQFPTAGIIYLSAGFDTKATFRNDKGGSITLFDPEFSTRYAPITSDVRLGFVYDNGNLTGTLAIPLSSQVNFGVPVDNTEGSVVFDSENTFNVKPSDIRIKNTIGDRISHVATTSAMRSLINNIS